MPCEQVSHKRILHNIIIRYSESQAITVFYRKRDWNYKIISHLWPNWTNCFGLAEIFILNFQGPSKKIPTSSEFMSP